MLSLERIRTNVAERGVTALAVVPDFDPRKDGASGLLAGLEAGTVNHLFLEAGKEALGGRVVPTVAASTHATDDPGFFEPSLIVVAGVLAPSVAVAEHVLRGVSAEYRHFQCAEHQTTVDRLVHRP